MKTSKLFILLFIVFSVCRAQSQSDLFVPLNVKDAYDEETRSTDGKPGPGYWQNISDYKIDASFDPASRLLSGSETVGYANNSPDTLKEIVIRLYPNIFRLPSQHDFPLDQTETNDGMVLGSISINNDVIDLGDATKAQITGTNLILKKVQTLPGSKFTMKCDWHFTVPDKNGIRMGTYDSTTFFIAYWYPQIAVYDDIDGWDKIQYTGQVEFYNDFNNYDVNITVPNNQCIWSTGILQNPENVMGPALLERYKKAMESEQVVNVISKPDYLKRMAILNNSNSTNTWHIKAENVPDFTFAMSDHYYWDGRAVNTGEKKVFVSAAYKPESQDFYEVCDVAARTVDYLSKVQPGVPFPFPKMTVFNGDGGMESPMMVNEGSSGTQHIWMVYVTTHEVAHSYFPFHMGINERKYAWMDEGWTQFLDEPIQWMCDTTIDFHERDIARFGDLSGQEKETPPIMLSYLIKAGDAYGNASYFRPAAAYNTLKDLLGEEKFLKCLKEYIKRWNGKHPMPYDFFFTFDDAAKEDLSWFWQPWFFESGYADLSIDSVITKSGEVSVLVSNHGTLPVPVELKITGEDGSVKIIHKAASVWKDGDESLWFKESIDGIQVKSVELGNKYIPDIEKDDNYWDKTLK